MLRDIPAEMARTIDSQYTNRVFSLLANYIVFAFSMARVGFYPCAQEFSLQPLYPLQGTLLPPCGEVWEIVRGFH